MRKLGDDYVRSEFRAHKAAKPEQVAQFVHGWSDYLVSSFPCVYLRVCFSCTPTLF